MPPPPRPQGKIYLTSRLKVWKLFQNQDGFLGSICWWRILPLKQNFLDSAMTQPVLLSVLDGLQLEPDGSFIIQFQQLGLNCTMETHNFLQTRDMKDSVDLRRSQQRQFVHQWSNALNNLISPIKFQFKFLVTLRFERSFLIRLEPKENVTMT